MSNKTKHTPEPWRYEKETKTIRSLPRNYWLATMDSTDGAINNEANAERIVACVNACAGIADPGTVLTMLEALQLIARSNTFFCGTSVVAELQNIARSAIAWAAGRTE